MLGSHASSDEVAYLKAKDIKEIVATSRTREEAIERVKSKYPDALDLAEEMLK